MKIINKIRKKLSRDLTVILIPHSPRRTVKISFTVSFLLFIILFWTGFTIWAGYINARHIDYWRTKFNHEIVKIKLLFFANRVKETQEYIDQIRQRDYELRQLLNMSTKKAIIVGEGKGGPQPQDRKFLNKSLSGKIDELSMTDLNYQIRSLRNQTKELDKSVEEIHKFIGYQHKFYLATPNMWPTKSRITSPYGYRKHPVTGKYEFHTGIDMANRKRTPIYTTADGKVMYVGWSPGYGKLVIINHGFGYRTLYGHLHKTLVKRRQQVKRGEKIGLMGETGTTTGVHVHYEIQYRRKTLNPWHFRNKDNFFTKKKKR